MKHKRISVSLDSFVLFFEELEKKKVAKPVKKTELTKKTFKEKLVTIKNVVFSKFKRNSKTKKVSKSLAVIAKQERRAQVKRGILGIGMLLVTVSIIYSTTIVREFVDSPESLVALAPQIIFAGVISIIAFCKIFK